MDHPSDVYHLASTNSPALKHVAVAHKRHYDPHVVELQRNAPLVLARSEIIKLPDYNGGGIRSSLSEAILERSSSRNFDPGSGIDIQELADLLFLANGIQFHADSQVLYKRNVPNSGSLGSVELFLCAIDVRPLTAGLYHYRTLGHCLELLKGGLFRDWLKSQVIFQPEHGDGAVVLFLTACVSRLVEKYGPRGYRLALIDVGHVSQNIYLTATSMGLKVCATAGFIDDELNRALGIDGLDTAAFLALTVGR